MVLPADDASNTSGKCPVDIDVYWPVSHKISDPPKLWAQWWERFKIALLAKHGLDYDDLLRDPTEKIKVPIPKTRRTDTEREQQIA